MAAIQTPSRPSTAPIPIRQILSPPSTAPIPIRHTPSPPSNLPVAAPASPAVEPPNGTSNGGFAQTAHLATKTSTTKPCLPPTPSLSEKSYSFLKTFASPSTHDLSTPTTPKSTERKYSRRTQRWRLWNLVWLEWVTTVILCVALFSTLYGYSQYVYLYTYGKHIFNSVTTGLSIALGLNLTESFRSYVKILRWRLLATQYRPLSEFELILGSEQKWNVLKLFWRVRNTKRSFLPSVTQLVCLCWLSCNLAAAILVAMLGLTYNIQTSPKYLAVREGNVSIIDFNSLTSLGYLQATATAQMFALNGMTYYTNTNSLSWADGGILNSFESLGNTSRYWFEDYDPNDISYSTNTHRYLDSTASCEAYPVVAGQFGNLTQIAYMANNTPHTQSIPAASLPGPGGMVFISYNSSNCGPRCTHISAFQAQTLPNDPLSAPSNVTHAQFFMCNNALSQVSNIPVQSAPAYYLSDSVARILAGAIGWSGLSGEAQYHAYNVETAVAFYTPATALDLAQLITQFSVAAVADMDNPRNYWAQARRQVVRGLASARADYLAVTWWHAGPLLIGIPCLQLLSLLIVIAVGNRAVIKDDSYLAAAKLYRSTIAPLGEKGSMLRGEEIADSLRDQNGEEPRLIYRWKDVEGEEGKVKRVGVFTEIGGESIDRGPGAAFVEGRFD